MQRNFNTFEVSYVTNSVGLPVTLAHIADI